MATPVYYGRYPEVEEHYDLLETLGSGGFAKVKLGVHKLTGEKVAVKIMNKHQLGEDLPRVYREMKALKVLHHQHICQLFQVIETDTMIYMILEYCPGGELFDYIVAKERLKETEARAFFRQIVSALMYVHDSGFIHRDLKPENLLLDDRSNIKLIDFGLVAEPSNISDLLQTCCGSPAYAAPELIQGGPYIGPRADVWSLGVLLYALINGFLPFDDDHTPELYRLIQKGSYDLTEFMSTGTIFMIGSLLQTNPERRITVERLLKHPWVMEGFKNPIDWQSKIDLSNLDEECVTELAHYHCISEAEMKAEILQWKYDHVTATYLLLIQQKLQSKTPHIRMPPKPMRTISGNYAVSPPLAQFVRMPRRPSSTTGDEDEDEDEYDDVQEDDLPEPVKPAVPVEPAPVAKPRTRRISVGQPMAPPVGEIKSIQKPVKPVIPAIANLIADLPSPQRSKPINPPRTPQPPRANIPLSPSFFPTQQVQTLPSGTSGGIVKTHSFHANLNRVVDRSPPLPQRTRHGSLTDGMDKILTKVKNIFRKPSGGDAGPREIKGMFNFNTTSMKSYQEVMDELQRVLVKQDIKFTRKDYKYLCKVIPKTKLKNSKEVRFTLEVCLLPNLNMIGIKRKRLRGDVWQYKDICDKVFEATHL